MIKNYRRDMREKKIHSLRLGYSTLILSLYLPDQKFENDSTQDSVIFDVFLIISAYIRLQALIYSYHDFI
jgi:hypothetical protein